MITHALYKILSFPVNASSQFVDFIKEIRLGMQKISEVTQTWTAYMNTDPTNNKHAG